MQCYRKPASGRRFCRLHQLDKSRDMLERRLGDDAVAEIEDEGAGPQQVEDLAHPPLEMRSAGEQQRADRDCPAPAARPASSSRMTGERHARVAADGIDAGLLRVALGQEARAARKADDRDVRAPLPSPARRCARSARSHQRANSSSGRLPAQLSKICSASAPAVDLAEQIVDRRLDQEIDQRFEGGRIAIGQKPRRGLVRAAAALDHVGGDRPGRAAKADQRPSAGSSATTRSTVS